MRPPLVPAASVLPESAGNAHDSSSDHDRGADPDTTVAPRRQKSLVRALAQGLARAVLVAVAGTVTFAVGSTIAVLAAYSPASETNATLEDTGRRDAWSRVARLDGME